MEKARNDFSTPNHQTVWVLPILQAAASARPTRDSAIGVNVLSESTRELIDKEKKTPKKVGRGTFFINEKPVNCTHLNY